MSHKFLKAQQFNPMEKTMHPLNRLLVALVLLIATDIASAQPQSPAVLWTKSYTHIGRSGPVSFGDAKALHEGSFIITGWVSDIRWQLNLWLCYVDSAGNTIWDRSIALRDSLREHEHNEEGESIVVTANNDLAVVGTTNTNEEGQPDIFFVLADTAGNVLLKRSYGRNDRTEEGMDIAWTGDGFAVLGGEGGIGFPQEGPNYLLLRLNEEGDSLWSRTYGQERKAYTPAKILPLSDRGFLLFGGRLEDIYDPNSPGPICIVRTDSTGEVVWERTYDHEQPVGILQTAEDEFVILNDAPVLTDEGWVEGMQLFWIDGEGYEVYTSEPIPTPNSAFTLARDFVQTTDGGFAVCAGNFRIIRTDADGNELYQEVYGDTAEGQGSSAYTICTTSDSGFAMGGFGPRIEGYGRPPILMRLGPEGWPDAVREPDAAPQVFMLSPAFPNPFNAQLTISYSVPFAAPVSLKVYDLSGRFVTAIVNEQPAVGYLRVVWNAQLQPAGVYLIRMNAPSFNQVQRVVLIK
jgi:hypothetical protein